MYFLQCPYDNYEIEDNENDDCATNIIITNIRTLAIIDHDKMDMSMEVNDVSMNILI